MGLGMGWGSGLGLGVRVSGSGLGLGLGLGLRLGADESTLARCMSPENLRRMISPFLCICSWLGLG